MDYFDFNYVNCRYGNCEPRLPFRSGMNLFSTLLEHFKNDPTLGFIFVKSKRSVPCPVVRELIHDCFRNWIAILTPLWPWSATTIKPARLVESWSAVIGAAVVAARLFESTVFSAVTRPARFPMFEIAIAAASLPFSWFPSPANSASTAKNPLLPCIAKARWYL